MDLSHQLHEAIYPQAGWPIPYTIINSLKALQRNVFCNFARVPGGAFTILYVRITL